MLVEAVRVKGRIAHVYVNEYGERCTEYTKYRPKVFEDSLEKTDWVDVKGRPVSPVEVNSIGQYVKEWENVSGKNYHGDVNEIIQFISDKYPDEIENNSALMPKVFWDIEVESSNGFPNPYEAREKIISIAAYFTHTKKIHVLHLKDGFKSKSDKVIEHKFDDERKLLDYWWSLINVDICMLVGWNTEGFDIPYLINRSENIGVDVRSKLPFGDYREKYDRDNNVSTYYIPGYIHYDYMALVKKYILEKQESYSLDFIAKKFLDKGKVSYITDHNTLQDLYENDYQKFIEYNIRDVMLVVEIDKKKKLIDLLLKLSYMSKINPNDVFSSQKLWEGLIYNKLKKNNIVVPRKFNHPDLGGYIGAFVKEPQRGMAEDVVSFDVNSEYPTTMINWNMSSSSLVPDNELPPELWKVKENLGKIEQSDDKEVRQRSLDRIIKRVINKEVDLSPLKKYQVSMGLNGAFFHTNKQDLVCQILDDIFNERMTLKKKSTELKKNGGDKDEIRRLDNTVWALKILINSYYGCVGNRYFRFYNREVAEAVTSTGQYIIQKVGHDVVQKVKDNTGNDNSLIYIDTDSNYFTLKPFVEKYEGLHGKKLEGDKRLKFLYKVCDNIIQPTIDKSLAEMTDDFGLYKNSLKMAREKVCLKSIFVEKKKYVMYVKDDEGTVLDKPKVSVKGLEIVRTSTPEIVREKLKDTVEFILSGNTESDLRKYISDIQKEFEEYEIEKISFPRSVSTVKKFVDKQVVYKKGTPVHVRGSILYNNLLKQKKLTKQYPLIKEGEKIRFIYLSMPNPLKENIISFPMGSGLPKELDLHQFIDKKTQFDKVYLSPLKLILEKIGWDINSKKTRVSIF